ncbi:hypothetical protein FPHYL_2617 [Fusarium phyllophilum]|uniref:Azaphilone pigments biosynthesis cluster protein L N-terminal domain-containing protein n=1 Tax=Fusarium phyllophilum TaxID=47803 RepID=A0A8H5NLU5_9HYPO|nr:hypothetical protein FPHYL_2617 [Fusarium phyllophilum]
MEPVGATASILTFVTVAFSATKSIYGALSAIKDGPEILSSINDEVSQLQSILQRILHVVSSTARPADRSKLEQMVKKCRDDLVRFEAKLRQLDVSGADGRRGQLWRKFKICFEEKDLDRIRHVIGRHVQLLTLYLGTIQDQQSSLIATQSTEIVARIQELQHISPTATQSTEMLARIQQLQETSPTATQLNEVLVSLQQLQQDMAVLQVSSTSAQTNIGSSGISPRVVELDGENSPISQQAALDDTIARLMRLLEKKPSIIEIDDAQDIFDDLERLLQSVQDDAQSTKAGEGDQNKDTDVSKEMKLFTSLMFSAQTLRVNQTVCQILPNDSHVFRVASHGSVQDLMRLIVNNKASLHDHDENGWSLLHHAVGNLPMMRLLIEEGLDVDEVAQDKNPDYTTETNPLIIAYKHRYDISFSEVLLCAGADPTVDLKGRLILVNILASLAHIQTRNILYRTFCISPFVLPGPRPDDYDVMFYFCQAWPESSAEGFNPGQERQTLDLLISHGYNLQAFGGKQTGLHGFFLNKRKSFSRVTERRDLLTHLISRGADPCTADIIGETPSYLAYGSMCKPCSMSQSSLMGDLWDTVLDICGYDIPTFRRNYPRKASYKNGYSREIFEELWRGREERCPYWNDEPWPEFSNKEAKSTFESTLAQGCPRSRVGYFERFENDGQYQLTRSYSDLNSYDEESDNDSTSSSGDEFEEEQSQPDPTETRRWGRDCEEILSEDESDGGVSL